MSKIDIDQLKCTNCGGCYELCPSGVFARPNPDSGPQPFFPKWCISCGQCVSICPVGAVTHDGYPDGTINLINKPAIPSTEQVVELLRSRRSIRSFKKKPVERETIAKLIDIARFAPSSTNTQSTEYVAVQDPEVLTQIADATVDFLDDVVKRFERKSSRVLLAFTSGPVERGAARMVPGFRRIVELHEAGYDPILRHGPTLIVFHGRKSVAMSETNANLALHNAQILANTMGLGCFYNGFIVAACQRETRIPELLSIPIKNSVWGTLVVGWPKFTHKSWIERKPARVTWI